MIEESTSGLRAGWLFRTALLWCLLTAVFFVLVSTAPLWPKGRLDENLKDASSLLNKEGSYWAPFGQMPLMDNFTEALMLNITGILNPEEAVNSAMRMDYTCTSEDMLDPLQDFQNFVEGKAAAKKIYARYWHGYTVVLRPLLSVITLADVRKISFFSLMTLFSATVILLVRRTDWGTALGFAVAMTLGGFPILAFCLAYVSNFVIALALMCAILHWNIRDEESLVRLFLLAGSLCVFLDFLTAPVVTFMLPLLALLLPALKRQPRWDRYRVKNILLLGVVWSAGYLLTWGAKWVLADIVLGEGTVLDAVNQILVRTGSAGGGMGLFDRFFVAAQNIYAILPLSIFITGGKGMTEIITTTVYRMRDAENLAWFERLTLTMRDMFSLLPSSILWSFMVTALVFAVYLVIIASLAIDGRKRNPIGALGYFSLAFLFLIPYLWYFVTANHAIFYIFTFRNQISSVWLFLILPHIMKKANTLEGTA